MPDKNTEWKPRDILYLATMVTVLGCTIGHQNLITLIEGIIKWIGSKF